VIVFNLLVVIAAKRLCDHIGAFLCYFREKSCRFGVVRVIFGIHKRVTLLCFRALSEMFSSFLGADVSVYWGNEVAAD